MTHPAAFSQKFPRRQFLKRAGLAAAVVAPALTSLARAGEPPIALALVGGAHIHTPNYIRILNLRKDAKVKYVWDHDPERSAARAKALHSEVTGDLQAIWSDPEVKAVVICSETNRHHELVLAAAKAGKHVFAEKPMGITAKESVAMAEALERAKLLFTTGYFMRTDPAHIYLKQQVEKGTFGKITRVRAATCHDGSLGHWFDTEWRWMADPKQAGVGAFGDLGTHSLDLLMWMFGEVDSITADIKVVTGNYGDCDESGEALLKFKNGITGTLAAGWVDVDNPVTFMISGTEGHAYVDRGRLYLKTKNIAGAKGTEPWADLPGKPPEPMDQFVNALAGKPDMPLVKPREAAARVCVMEAAYESAKKHAWARPLRQS
jgi:predicted dehydrogenase